MVKLHITDHDIAIIGGGISGFYVAEQLKRKHKKLNICLYEKSSRIGGRINSIKTDSGVIEAGGARFNDSHKTLFSLIDRFGLRKNIIPIPSTWTNVNFKKSKIKGVETYEDIMNILVKKSKVMSKHYLSNTTIENFCVKTLGRDYADELLDLHPYWSEIALMNCYYALKMFQKDLNESQQYYILNGGLIQVIQKLKSSFVKLGGKIKMTHTLKDIDVDKTISLTLSHDGDIKTVTTKRLVCALDKTSLENINYLKKNLKKEFNAILCSPLLRIYQKFPVKNKESWFSGIGKVVTGTRFSALRYFIPINPSEGTVMTSYTDGIFTEYWMHHLEKGTLEKTLKKELKKVFPDKKIPDPVWTKTYYWEDAGCYWKPGSDPDKITKKMIQPFKEKIFICGDSFSFRQVWQEGALETSQKVVNKILKDIDLIKKRSLKKGAKIKIGGKLERGVKKKNSLKQKGYTLNEVKKHNKETDAWTVIRGKVYDITNWFEGHPGGKGLLRKAMGKDVTKLFESISAHHDASGKLNLHVMKKLKGDNNVKLLGKLI